MTWTIRGNDYFSTACGRFDLLRTGRGDWLVIDADHGRTRRFLEVVEARDWVREQLKGASRGRGL